MGKEIERELEELLGREKILYNEPMKRHTTFRVGGNAQYFLMPGSAEEIQAVVSLLKRHQIPFLTVGNGSNLLVGDRGIEGAVLHLGRSFGRISAEKNEICAQAGALLSAVANRAAKEGLAGLEFAAGIPGSLGGAVTMNAGAYGGEMKHVIRSVEVLTQDGQVRTMDNKDMEFGYRHSIVPEQGLIVLSAVFRLDRDAEADIRARMEELSRKRREKQPLEYASAGSTFKRPEGYYAGKLIMEAGLAGFSSGGACVSEKHCGFVINTGDATARDVVTVMEHVKQTVREKFSVELEPEVRLTGRF